VKISGLLLGISILLGAASSLAERNTYESEKFSSFPSPTYPNLNLNSIDQLKLVVDNISSSSDAQLYSAEFSFPNANNIKAFNFEKIGDTYRSIVSNAWIYKKIIVDITPRSGFGAHYEYTARIYVGEESSKLNDTSSVPGILIYEYGGSMRDKTYNNTADSTSVIRD
jgi:hypothetical protein